MTSPDPVEAFEPLPTAMVTTVGSTLSATAVASQAVALVAEVVEPQEQRSPTATVAPSTAPVLRRLGSRTARLTEVVRSHTTRSPTMRPLGALPDGLLREVPAHPMSCLPYPAPGPPFPPQGRSTSVRHSGDTLCAELSPANSHRRNLPEASRSQGGGTLF